MLLRRLIGTALVLSFVVACGSRTKLRRGHEDVLIGCLGPEDCDQSNLCSPQVCVEGYCAYDEPVDCGEAPDCAEVSCNPDTGQCETRPLTEDLDRDGFFAPLSGYASGADGACGDDCDDFNPSAFPGGEEVCDGVDNDCDGVVDNGESYLSMEITESISTVVLREDLAESSIRGGAYGGGAFVAGYWGEEEPIAGEGADTPKLDYIQGLTSEGNEAFGARRASQTKGPTFGPHLAWNGRAFGAIWSDTDGGAYDVYFSMFDAAGNKLIPDVRVTQTDRFSINPRLLFDQSRFVGVWEHEELDGNGQEYRRILARFFSAEGEVQGRSVAITDVGLQAERPVLAATDERFGLTYVGENQTVWFRSYSKDFGERSEALLLGEKGGLPRIANVSGNFLVVWGDQSDNPLESPTPVGVHAALVDETGTLLNGPELVSPVQLGTRAYYPAILPLGDRFMLFYQANFDAPGYRVYATVLDPNLSVVEPLVALTGGSGAPGGMEAALSDTGKVGFFFNEYVPRGYAASFLSLGCETPEEPPIR